MENQVLILLCIFAVITRIPRIVERWKAPLLRGPGWFFSVEVPADFQSGAGAIILRHYRLTLFRPWMIEAPIFTALILTGNSRFVFLLIFVVTWLTRLNYYAARRTAENRAKQFELQAASEPVSSVTLSIQTRTLRDYTNLWIEAAIILTLGGSVAWQIYRYFTLHDWQATRLFFSVMMFYVYLQGGLLLVKRGFVRARCVAPADNAEQYLEWRESLRRLSTMLCDYTRLSLALVPLMFDIQPLMKQWQGGAVQAWAMAGAFAGGGAMAWFEWRRRLQYLEVAKRTKPAKFLVLPDVQEAMRPICFQPSLPVLLLNGPNGYALNLASSSAKLTALYLAGFALLWICLIR